MPSDKGWKKSVLIVIEGMVLTHYIGNHVLWILTIWYKTNVCQSSDNYINNVIVIAHRTELCNVRRFGLKPIIKWEF